MNLHKKIGDGIIGIGEIPVFISFASRENKLSASILFPSSPEPEAVSQGKILENRYDNTAQVKFAGIHAFVAHVQRSRHPSGSPYGELSLDQDFSSGGVYAVLT